MKTFLIHNTIVFGLALSAVSASARPTTFQGLGFLAGGGAESHAYAVSADGSVIVGRSDAGRYGIEAFRWTRATGMAALGFPDPLANSPVSVANAVSGNGSVVVGYATRAVDPGDVAFQWTKPSGLTAIGASTLEGATGISLDGSVVVGSHNTNDGAEAFVWTQSAGMVGLGDLPGGIFDSHATAVSADGTVVVGSSYSSSGREAFQWTESTGLIGLGTLSGGTFDSAAVAISADGTVIVGLSNSDQRFQPFRWTQAGGMVGLGFLPGATPLDAAAAGVSGDGAIVVGSSYDSASIRQAFRWDSRSRMKSVADILRKKGIKLSGWNLVHASAISADGRTIVGDGVHNGAIEAWMATIPRHDDRQDDDEQN